MTHQQMEIKLKELEKRIDALEKEHCEYKPFTIDELEDGHTKELLRSFQGQKVLDSVIPEQDPFINKPCVSIGVCENDKNKVLDKIRTEIDRQEKWLLHAGCTAYNVDIAFDAIKSAVVAESEG